MAARSSQSASRPRSRRTTPARRPSTAATRWRRRVSSTATCTRRFRFARARRRIERAVVPVRPHVPLRGRAGRRRRARVGALAATEMLATASPASSSPATITRRPRCERRMATGMRMVLAVSSLRPHQGGHGRAARGDDREHRDRCIAKTRSWTKYPRAHGNRLTVSASFRGMNNASDELILALKARQQARCRAPDPRLLFLFHARCEHRPRRESPRSSGWSISACSTSAC